MITYYILAFVGIAALIAPVIFILATRLSIYKTFPILIVFYTPIILYSLIAEGIISVSPEMKNAIGVSLNIMEIPLMLLFITYFSPSQKFTKRLLWVVGIYILFEVGIIISKGITVKAINIILLPGLLITFMMTAFLFSKFLKTAVVHGRRVGKAILTASIMFNTGVYIILYLIIYGLNATDPISLFILYYLGAIITSITLCAGIVHERRHIVKLQEALKVRKELAEVYKNTDRSIVFRNAPMLDFDRELWN